MTGRERQVVVYTGLGHYVNHGPDLTYAALLVVIGAEFGVGPFILGAVANAAALGSGLTSVLGGLLSDRFGSQRILLVVLLVGGVLALLVAASANLWMLAVTFTALGLVLGLYHPTAMALISRSIRARSMAFGYHGMAGNMGTALSPFIAVVLLGFFDWRAPFILLGTLSLLVGIATLLSPVQEATSVPRVRQREPRTAAEPAPGPFGLGIYWGPLLVILAMGAVMGFIFRGLIIFLPLHLEQNLGIAVFNADPVTVAGYFTTVILLFGIAGQYIGGYLGQRLSRERLLVPVTLAVVPFLLLTALGHGVGLIAVASLVAFLFYIIQPVYTTLIADYSPPRLQGSVFGVSFLAGYGVGSFAGTFFGYLAEAWGTPWIFASMAGLDVLLVLCAISLTLAALSRERKAQPRG